MGKALPIPAETFEVNNDSLPKALYASVLFLLLSLLSCLFFCPSLAPPALY